MVPIDPHRLLADLRELRSFGATCTGVVRTSFSKVDMESRRWLVDKMTAAGLDARIDGVGNVVGASPHAGKALLMGSHTDTQPTGGWLDGAMGVIYALEVARALRECGDARALPLDIASWMDEEGAYLGCLGSRSFCGAVSTDQIRAAAAPGGHRLTQAIGEAGLDGVPPARLENDRYAGYLEAHIEQGPYLEAEGKRIGVVTAIVGIRDFELSFAGAQNHAGTTPMPLRKDAGAALIDLAVGIREAFARMAGARTVWTIGRVAFDPGASSIIPGRAAMSLQFRDPETCQLDAMEELLKSLVAEANAKGPVAVSIAPSDDHAAPAAMDAGLQDHLAAAAERHAPDQWLRMPSGAGHDAQIMAQRMPSAMLFVPSIGGVSHDFAEDSREDDIALGCQVFATAAATILEQANR